MMFTVKKFFILVVLFLIVHEVGASDMSSPLKTIFSKREIEEKLNEGWLQEFKENTDIVNLLGDKIVAWGEIRVSINISYAAYEKQTGKTLSKDQMNQVAHAISGDLVSILSLLSGVNK